MTKKCYEQIKKELERLKRVERAKVIADIAEARAHGDLSENAEYSAAKEKQSFVEGRIMEMENKLANAQVIETNTLSSDKVVFGATVYLFDLHTEEEKRYTIVGEDEADLKDGKISVHSPVGKALIGHRVSDVVKITAPAKTMEYEIQKIIFE